MTQGLSSVSQWLFGIKQWSTQVMTVLTKVTGLSSIAEGEEKVCLGLGKF